MREWFALQLGLLRKKYQMTSIIIGFSKNVMNLTTNITSAAVIMVYVHVGVVNVRVVTESCDYLTMQLLFSNLTEEACGPERGRE